MTHRTSSTRGRPFIPTRFRSSTSTTTTTTTSSTPTRKSSSSAAELPATVRETIQRKSSIGLQKPAISNANDGSNDHPQDNEISGSGVDNREASLDSGVPEPSGPYRVNNAEQPTHQAKLHLGAVIALGVFGGFVFLAAVITTIVILIRR